MSMLARGDIHDFDLEPTVGSEQGKQRPCVVVSIDEMTMGEVVTVVPVTSTEYRGDPAYVARLDMRETGLPATSWALAHQVRTVSKRRLGTKRGRVAPEALERVDEALRYVLGLEC
jgi:mRNA interferase MazF